jgi:hypothetical protein
MNGRAYDPDLGRFLGVDPFISFPENSQALNPYSYVMNNPLSHIDPTGYVVMALNGGAYAAVPDDRLGNGSNNGHESGRSGAEGQGTRNPNSEDDPHDSSKTHSKKEREKKKKHDEVESSVKENSQVSDALKDAAENTEGSNFGNSGQRRKNFHGPRMVRHGGHKSGGTRADEGDDRGTASNGSEFGYRTSEEIDGNVYHKHYYNVGDPSCLIWSCNLDLKDPETQRALVAERKATAKDIATGLQWVITIAVLHEPIGTFGTAATYTGDMLSLAEFIVTSDPVALLPVLTSRGVAYISEDVGIGAANAARIGATVSSAQQVVTDDKGD